VSPLDLLWLASPILAYLGVVVVGIWYFRRPRIRELRTIHPAQHRVLLAAYLALVFTPSVVSDFFLFMVPGPALLGFLFMIPGTLVHMFSDPGILASTLRLTAVYHILPLAAGFFVAYLLLWVYSRVRRSPDAQSV
jgi:hypothetical protein